MLGSMVTDERTTAPAESSLAHLVKSLDGYDNTNMRGRRIHNKRKMGAVGPFWGAFADKGCARVASAAQAPLVLSTWCSPTQATST